jgi:AcrR family transcriptional regulator
MNEKQDTKSRILDSAEKLFGLNGFEATSLRDITAEAQVNLAAVNYHFQSKESLIDAVIARRIEPVNQKRLEMLEATGPHPSLEQILTAFVAPLLEQNVSSVVPLIGRMMSDPTQFVERVFKKYIAPVSRRFQDAIQEEIPGIRREELLWGIHFTAGVMTHVMCWSQVLPDISGGLCDVTDRTALIERVVSFTAAGFRAPARQAVAMEEKG